MIQIEARIKELKKVSMAIPPLIWDNPGRFILQAKSPKGNKKIGGITMSEAQKQTATRLIEAFAKLKEADQAYVLGRTEALADQADENKKEADDGKTA